MSMLLLFFCYRSDYAIFLIFIVFCHTDLLFVIQIINIYRGDQFYFHKLMPNTTFPSKGSVQSQSNFNTLTYRQGMSDVSSSLHVFINFITQSNSRINVKFSVLQSDSDCSLVSKLCEVLANHPTLVQLSFEKQRILSKKRLLQTYSKKFPICSNAFIHLVRFLDVEQLTELHLSCYSQVFKDCTQCGGSGELARKCLGELISKSQKLKSLNLRECHSTVFGSSGAINQHLTDNIQSWASDEKCPSITLDRIKK